MHTRDAERISTDLKLRFPCRNTFYSGTVTNLSENGMFINADISFPIKSSFEVFVQLKNEKLNVPVKIVRIVKSGGFYEGMGVKILNLPKKYLELLIKLNLSSQS
jgi:Tfp pilus assembly protein PilZ